MSVHRLVCKGCGTPLPPQIGRPGSLVRYHRECQVVRRKWSRCQQSAAQISRYRDLVASGACRDLALFGCTGQARFRGTIEALTATESG